MNDVDIEMDEPAPGEEWARAPATPMLDRLTRANAKLESYLASPDIDNNRLINLIISSNWSFADRLLVLEALKELPEKSGPKQPRFWKRDVELILSLASRLGRVPTDDDLGRAHEYGMVAGAKTEAAAVRRLRKVVENLNLQTHHIPRLAPLP